MQHLDLLIFLRLSFRVELRFLRRRVELWGTLLLFLFSSAPAFHCQASRTLNWGWFVSSYSISSSASFPSSSASLYCSLKSSRAFFWVLCWRNVNCSLEKKFVDFLVEVPGCEGDVHLLLGLEADPQNLTFDGRSWPENCRREKDLYQMRCFSIDAKITVRDTTLKNVVTNQMCWKVWTFVRRFFSLVDNLLAPNFH